MISTFGDGTALVALTLRLQADGAQPYAVSLLLTAGALPALLVVRWAGRLADTRDSRHLLLAGGMIEVAAAIPLIFVHATVAIVLLAGVLGAAACVTAATWSALLPRICGEDRLAAAVSTQQSLNLLALVGAPALGALLAGEFGTGVPIAVDAASFVVVTVAAALIRTRRAPAPGPIGPEPERATGGLAVLRRDRILWSLLAGVTLVVLLVGMGDIVLVYLVRETLHASALYFGLTEASWMVGMVIGSLGARRLHTQSGQVRATIAGAALACAAVACFAIAPAAWTLLPLSIVGGLGNGCAGASLTTLLTLRTPDSSRGRVSAIANAALGSAQGGALLLGGALAVTLSPRMIYAIAGVLGLSATTTLALTSGRRGPTTSDSATPDRRDQSAGPGRRSAQCAVQATSFDRR